MTYSDGSKIANAWNTALTSNNGQYTAGNASWNGSVNADSSVTFGMQVSKTAATSAVAPTLSGSCQ